MSAFILGTDHIDYLVTATVDLSRGSGGFYAPVNAGDVEALVQRVGATAVRRMGDRWTWVIDHDPDALGQVLLAENIHAVQTRYPEETPGQLPGPVPNPSADDYQWRRTGFTDAAQTIRAVECWRYQTAEYPDCDQAPGWRAMDVLYRRAVSRLLERSDAVGGEWTRPPCSSTVGIVVEARRVGLTAA